MADPGRIVCEEDIAGYIHNCMKRHQLRKEDVKESRRFLDVPGYGKFSCNKCGNIWWSFYSWLTIDLKEQRRIKRWKMKCKMCLRITEPTFSLEEFDKMLEKAIMLYLGKCDPRYIDRNSSPFPRFFKPPHVELLCQKCNWNSATPCWTTNRIKGYGMRSFGNQEKSISPKKVVEIIEANVKGPVETRVN